LWGYPNCFYFRLDSGTFSRWRKFLVSFSHVIQFTRNMPLIVQDIKCLRVHLSRIIYPCSA